MRQQKKPHFEYFHFSFREYSPQLQFHLILLPLSRFSLPFAGWLGDDLVGLTSHPRPPASRTAEAMEDSKVLIYFNFLQDFSTFSILILQPQRTDFGLWRNEAMLFSSNVAYSISLLQMF